MPATDLHQRIEALYPLAGGERAGDRPAHAARADLYRRLGRNARTREAAGHYRRTSSTSARA